MTDARIIAYKMSLNRPYTGMTVPLWNQIIGMDIDKVEDTKKSKKIKTTR